MTKEELIKLEKEGIIEILFAVIEQLTTRISELEAQLNQNSKNPPSSDKFDKPKPKSLRKPSGKKAGGQQGHKGSSLQIIQNPTDYAVHNPNE